MNYKAKGQKLKRRTKIQHKSALNILAFMTDKNKKIKVETSDHLEKTGRQRIARRVVKNNMKDEK